MSPIEIATTPAWRMSACALMLAGCAPARSTDTPPKALLPEKAVTVPTRYDRHLLDVPVRVDDGIDAQFIVDTGIGINLVSEKLCRQVHCIRQGTYTGRRMSGQSVTVSLATIDSLTLGSYRRQGVVVGVLDGLADSSSIDGFLSLGFFSERALTIDDANGTLVIEDDTSLARRASVGTSVPVTVEHQGPAVTFTVPMAIGDAATARCEVDTGSNSLILDERFLEILGVDVAHAKVTTGKDETGATFSRTFSTIDQSIHPVSVDSLRQERPTTMFQRIIHDGLVGHAFLRNWTVTFDVRGARMIFGPAARR